MPIAAAFGFDWLLRCSAEVISAEDDGPTKGVRGGMESHILSVPIRSSGLVDVHPVLVAPVLPSRSPTGGALRVLLLPQTLRDFLEHRVESLFVLCVLAHLGGIVFRE